MTDPVVLGHSLRETYPQPSGWRARCECGDTFHGITRAAAEDRWDDHLARARAARGIT